MTNRVLLGPLGGDHVFRVSLPGRNVLDNSLVPDDMAFDSRWTDAGNLYMAGSVSLPESSTSPVTVSFGRSFSTPPLVLAVRSCGKGFVQMPVLTGRQWTAGVAVVFEDQVEFWRESTYIGWLSGSSTCYYKIFRNIYD